MFKIDRLSEGLVPMPQATPETVKDLLPGIDCGLCGNPSCATFARRISAGYQQPGDCVICPAERLGEIHDLLDTGIHLGEPIQNERVVEISPCAEYGKVTVEVQLKKPEGSPFDLFDPCQMCNAFHDMGMLDKVRCSLKMGYAIAEFNGKRLHIFKRGKVVIRAADSRSDALQTLGRISKALWPTVICTCGDLVVDCLGGSNCTGKNCPGCVDGRNCAALGGKNLEWGYDNGITREIVPGTVITKGNDETKDLFSSALRGINEGTVPLIREIAEGLSREAPAWEAVESSNDALGRALKGSETDLKGRIINEENERLVALLVVLGHLNCVRRISDALYELGSREKYDLGDVERRILMDFPLLMERTGKALASMDVGTLRDVAVRASVTCTELREHIEENDIGHGVAAREPHAHLFKIHHSIGCLGSMLETL